MGKALQHVRTVLFAASAAHSPATHRDKFITQELPGMLQETGLPLVGQDELLSDEYHLKLLIPTGHQERVHLR